jgi:hypothetical protein
VTALSPEQIDSFVAQLRKIAAVMGAQRGNQSERGRQAKGRAAV